MAMFLAKHSLRTESCGQFMDLSGDPVGTVARSPATIGMAYYRHEDVEVRAQNIGPGDEPNAQSHCRRALSGPTAQTTPIVDAELMLGRRQRIFSIEPDRARPRKVFLQVLGG